eukprot:m.26825 g.26825  ORF g.26825 m.26825 type:complete len:51 (-) comp8878_c0_seq1:95-247(-)
MFVPHNVAMVLTPYQVGLTVHAHTLFVHLYFASLICVTANRNCTTLRMST